MPRAVNDELMKDAQQARAAFSGGSDLNFWNIPEDGKKHLVRILPGTYGNSRQRWFVASAQHWAGRKPYECPASNGADCPFCTVVAQLREQEKTVKERQKKGDDATQAKCDRQLKKIGKMIRNMLPSPRFLVNVLVRADAAPVPKVLRLTKGAFDQVFEVWESADTDILDVNAGHDFNLTKTEVNGRTSYSAKAALSQTAVDADADKIEEILKARFDLEKLVKASSAEDLATACSEAVTTLQAELKGEEQASDAKKAPSVNLLDDEEPAKPAAKPPVTKTEPTPPVEEAEPAPVKPTEKPAAEAEPEKAAPKASASKGAADLKSQLNNLLGEDD